MVTHLTFDNLNGVAVMPERVMATHPTFDNLNNVVVRPMGVMAHQPLNNSFFVIEFWGWQWWWPTTIILFYFISNRVVFPIF